MQTAESLGWVLQNADRLLSLLSLLSCFLWLVLRFGKLYLAPKPSLIRKLGVELPSTPSVTVGALSTDSLSLQWSTPYRPCVARYQILLDGNLLGECDKRETSVNIVDLRPGTYYTIQLIACNSKGFKSPRSIIRVKTKPAYSDTPQQAGKEKGQKNDRPRLQPHIPLPRSKKPETRRRRSISQSQPSPAKSLLLKEMEAELDAVRKESNEIENLIKVADDEHTQASAGLQSDIDTLRDRRREEEAKRSSYRAETKQLQEQKRSVDAIRAKAEAGLQAKEDELQKFQDDIARWEEEDRDAAKRIEFLTRRKRDELKKVEEAEAALSGEINVLRDEIDASEAHVRSLLDEIRQVEAEKVQRKEAIAKGPLPEQVAHDEQLEKEWQRVQDVLTVRFESVHAQYIAAEKDFQEASEELVTTQQEVNHVAVPKKPKSRRRPRKVANVSGPLNSYPLFDSKFADSQDNPPSTNSSSPSTMLKQVSRLTMESEIINGLDQLSPTVDRLLPSNLFAAEESSTSYMRRNNSAASTPSSAFFNSSWPSLHHGQPMSSDSMGRGISGQLPQAAIPQTTAQAERKAEDLGIGPRISEIFVPRASPKLDSPLRMESNALENGRALKTTVVSNVVNQDPIGTRPRAYSHSSQHSIASSQQDSTFRRQRELSKQFDALFDPLGPSGLLGSAASGRSPRPSSISSFDMASRLPMPSTESATQFGWPAPENENVARSPLSLKWSDLSLVSPRSLLLNPKAPTFERRHASVSDFDINSHPGEDVEDLLEKDDLHEDSSNVHHENASLSTSRSRDSTALEREITRESIFTRSMKGLKLTRKDSATKFNLLSSWKKEGGFFGKKEKEKESEDEEGTTSSKHVISEQEDEG